MPIIGVLISFLTSWFARFVGVSALRYLAFKAIAGLLIMTILPIVLYNLFNAITGEILTIISGQVESGNFHAWTFEVTGVAAWLASCVKIPEAFSLIFSACAFRVALSFIPFLGRV